MDPFEAAKTHADTEAPAPADKPIAAAATAFGFGLFVIATFFALRWLGVDEWIAWFTAAALYAAIAYGDCVLGWRAHRRAYHDRLADLKAERAGPSVH